MNVNEMSQEEKSVMLARLCGWLTTDDYFHSYFPPNGKGGTVNHTKGYSVVDIFTGNGPHRLTLYDPANMALAWRVLNWVDGAELSNRFNRWYYNELWMKAPPGEAQAAWLDKVLELAIEAGMVPA